MRLMPLLLKVKVTFKRLNENFSVRQVEIMLILARVCFCILLKTETAVLPAPFVVVICGRNQFYFSCLIHANCDTRIILAELVMRQLYGFSVSANMSKCKATTYSLSSLLSPIQFLKYT